MKPRDPDNHPLLWLLVGALVAPVYIGLLAGFVFMALEFLT